MCHQATDAVQRPFQMSGGKVDISLKFDHGNIARITWARPRSQENNLRRKSDKITSARLTECYRNIRRPPNHMRAGKHPLRVNQNSCA
jgi:hypothetical protein